MIALLAAFAFGALRAQIAARDALRIPVAPGDPVPIACEGVVENAPRAREWGASFDLQLSSCGKSFDSLDPASGLVRVNASRIPDGLAEGERVRAVLAIKRPRHFRNPGSFDYPRYLQSLGISAVASARGPVARAEGGAVGLSPLIARARGRITRSIDAAVPPSEAAILRALAVGDQALITQDLRSAFSRSGLAHLLALSGLHVAYVALIIYWIVRLTIGAVPALVRRIPVRMIAAAVTIPAVWTYVIFTGCPISAVRAALMISVWLAGVLFMRRSDALSSIATAVIAIVAIMPHSVLSVSFQLSVAAVLGIALISAPVMRLVQRPGKSPGIRRRALHWIAGLAAVSFAAGVATAPAVAYHFKIFTAVGLVANMIAVPLTGFLLQPAVLLATGAASISPDAAAWFWSVAGMFAGPLSALASFASDAGDPLIGAWAPTLCEAALAYAAILCAALWKRLPYRKLLVSSLAIAMFTDALYYKALPAFDDRLSVTFLDVGQGDSALVRFPGGKTLLIDGGGLKGSSIDAGRDIIAPALLAMGIREIDWVLLTHPHYDHYAGLSHIVREFGPGLVWTNGLDAPEKEMADWDALLAAASDAGVPLVPVTRRIELSEGGASLCVLPPAIAHPDDLNDSSIVAAVSLKGRRFLFTGDLTQNGEAALVRSGEDLTASVLKVGHHGSSDASGADFLSRVSAELAVISAGVGNPYGFPHPDALARIDASGAAVLRTDQLGAINIATDGDSLDVSSYCGMDSED